MTIPIVILKRPEIVDIENGDDEIISGLHSVSGIDSDKIGTYLAPMSIAIM